jgi:NifB/MoaA-like Fe-S oxidoreductase
LSYYEGYDLREDGIGMLRKFTQDFRRALPRFLKRPFKSPPVPTALATGRAAAGMFADVVMPGLARKSGLEVQLVPVDNLFFGNTVTVAGLLTATDYRGALAGRSGFARVLLAAHSLRADGAVFLDDGTPEGLAAELGVELVPVPDSAQALLELLWGYPPPRRVKPAGPQAAEVAIYGC